jgi:centractin
VLLTEPPLNPRSNRDTAAQILFETFNVPALYTSIQAVLSLYASGRTTGIVMDSGDGVSHAVPVYEGFAMPSSIRRIDVAGRDVTEYMQTLLRKSGYIFHTSAEKEVVRMIKEKVSYVAADPKKEEKEWSGGKTGETKVVEYVLPDGQKLKVSRALWTQGNTFVLTGDFRLVLSDFEPLRFSSILKLLAWSTLASIKSLSTQ